ncbi:MAG: ABC transporter ATP-binding protein [Gemmatimonadaceae bacterium]
MDSSEPEPVIRLDGIGKIYLSEEVETRALYDVSFEVARGEYVAISGPSGCGKTTLLSILGLLDVASTGRYFLGGHDVAELSGRQRARIRNSQIGFIFQAFNLLGDLTVWENVALPLSYRGLDPRDRRKCALNALERMGMAHRLDHYPAQLSGGQQQRVAVARAIAGEPLIILADEPTGNLDSENGEQVMEIFAQLHRTGSTICMVTHDPRHARHAERTIELLDGSVRAIESRSATHDRILQPV